MSFPFGIIIPTVVVVFLFGTMPVSIYWYPWSLGPLFVESSPFPVEERDSSNQS